MSEWRIVEVSDEVLAMAREHIIQDVTRDELRAFLAEYEAYRASFAVTITTGATPSAEAHP